MIRLCGTPGGVACPIVLIRLCGARNLRGGVSGWSKSWSRPWRRASSAAAGGGTMGSLGSGSVNFSGAMGSLGRPGSVNFSGVRSGSLELIDTHDTCARKARPPAENEPPGEGASASAIGAGVLKIASSQSAAQDPSLLQSSFSTCSMRSTDWCHFACRRSTRISITSRSSALHSRWCLHPRSAGSSKRARPFAPPL